ncbi:MAG: MotA/TolQ/ExbB proton channel family protein [Lachnospiraceae bacterium]|nr:MotA/TolQ/ExbB proton channel family protein [Lachnospiraceae bacterium]
MSILCKILDALINPLIYLLAIAEFVLLCVSVWTLAGFRKRIADLNKDNVSRIKLSKTSGKREVKKSVETVESRNWDDFEKFQRDYQKGSVWYSIFSLVIQLFTLLGILGTVVGLYIAMNNGEDLYAGVGLALTTTINGILFAVIYKLFDIGITAMLLNFIDDGMDIFVDSYKADSDDATRTAMIEKGRESIKRNPRNDAGVTFGIPGETSPRPERKTDDGRKPKTSGGNIGFPDDLTEAIEKKISSDLSSDKKEPEKTDAASAEKETEEAEFSDEEAEQ